MLLAWLLIAIATGLACELVLRLPLPEQIRGALGTARKAFGLMRNPAVSDHWKELVMPRYALALMKASLFSAGLMLLAFAPIFAIALLDIPFNLAIVERLSDWRGILGTCAIAAVYLALRRRIQIARTAKRTARDRSDEGPRYSTIDRALHGLALGSSARAELLFDIEQALAPAPPPQAADGRHVLVTGLARSGTTALLRGIGDNDSFASLTYRDMPFVLAPNLWARITSHSRGQMTKTERAHGDGVMVDFDSPEALEEPFWRCFCGNDYIQPDALIPHDVDDHTWQQYHNFISHILARYRAPRYLAKNNNAVLRLKAWLTAFPNATAIIPFRNPVTQAHSLQAQHERFLTDKDPFTAKYMSWLAHHEFGGDHRPFVIDGCRPDGAPDQLDYWLSLWMIVYRRLAEDATRERSRIVPIAYEDLCGPDQRPWQALSERIDITIASSPFEARKQALVEDVDTKIGMRAHALYQELRELSHMRLNITNTGGSRMVS